MVGNDASVEREEMVDGRGDAQDPLPEVVAVETRLRALENIFVFFHEL